MCIVYAVIVVGGWQYVSKMYQVGIDGRLIEIAGAAVDPRLVLPLGFALLAFRFGQTLWRLARGEKARLLGDEAAEAMKLYEGEVPKEGPP